MEVPKEKCQEVISSCHDPPTAGHLGFMKTFARVAENYYCPRMRRDILSYVKHCTVCGAQKPLLSGRFGLMGSEKKVNFPWQILGVDLLGSFPRSSKGHTHLLVAVDWFSKYVLLFPLRKASATNVIRFIEDNVFLVFGVP
jgi:hypothetical protein